MKLSDFKLLKLMPKFMQDDETTNAYCKALQPQIKEVVKCIDENLVRPFLDKAPEKLLDEIAFEKNMKWYDKNASIDIKRRLIKSADFVKRHLGTVAAVERTITDYFSDGEVEEWFNNGGEPFTFKVHTTDTSVTEGKAQQFALAVNETKNVRSHLVAVVVNHRATCDFYVGFGYHECETISCEIGGL